MHTPAHTLKSVFVTGASGFVGTHLVRRLLNDKFSVVALVRKRPDTSSLTTRMPAGVHAVPDDGSVHQLADVMRQYEVSTVLHCAAYYVAAHTADDVIPLVQSNVLMGARVAEAMRQSGVRSIITLGTMWEYSGDDPTIYRPANLYAATKKAMDDLLVYYADAAQLKVGILQFADTYGPQDKRKKLIPALLRALRDRKALDLSPGGQQLDLLHVEDVVAGIVHAAALAQTWPAGTVSRFCLSAGQMITVRQLVAELERVFEQPLPVNWGARPYRDREVMHPRSAYPVLPGWGPKVELRDGLRSLSLGERP